MNHTAPYLQSILDAYPELSIASADFNTDGQNNTVLTLNNEFIFRFPKYPVARKRLEMETAILAGLQGHMTLNIPHPIFTHLDAPIGEDAFVGYRMIPGEPLWRETLLAIHAEHTLDTLALQLAGFLKELHSVPAREVIAC